MPSPNCSRAGVMLGYDWGLGLGESNRQENEHEMETGAYVGGSILPLVSSEHGMETPMPLVLANQR